FYEQQTGENINMEFFQQAGGELRATIELEAEANQIKADVLMVAHPEIYALQEKFDVFQELNLPNLESEEIPDQFKDPIGDGYTTSTSIQPYLLVYNTDRVSDDDIPISWSDLLNERWKNR